jgi:hypothetical protein
LLSQKIIHVTGFLVASSWPQPTGYNVPHVGFVMMLSLLQLS